MVVSDLIHRLGDRPWVPSRIKALSTSDLRLSPKLKRRLSGGAFLLASVVGALVANEISRSSALKDWEENHSPGPLLVQQSIASSGLARVTDIPMLHRTLRQLPATSDLDGSIWIDPNGHWVVLFRGSEETIPAEAYRWADAPKSPPVAGWEPLGRGWLGFEKLLGRLKETSSKRSSSNRSRKTVAYDPREIRY